MFGMLSTWKNIINKMTFVRILYLLVQINKGYVKKKLLVHAIDLQKELTKMYLSLIIKREWYIH